MKTNRATFLSSLAAGFATLLTYGAASADSIYVSNSEANTISIINGSTVTSFGAAPGVLNFPNGIAFDPLNGNLFVANGGSGTVAEFTAAGVLVNPDYASGLGNAQGMAFDSSGNLYVVSKDEGNVYEIASGGAVSLYASTVTGINDVAFDKSNNLYITTGSNNGIVIVSPSKVYTNMPITGPHLHGPDGLAFDSSGNLVVVNDFDPSVEKIAPGGHGTTLASGSPLNAPRGVVYDSTQANLYVADWGSGMVSEYNSITGALEHVYTGFSGPAFLADLPAGSPVPEPSTYALLLGGLGALYFFNRRRQLASVKA